MSVRLPRALAFALWAIVIISLMLSIWRVSWQWLATALLVSFLAAACAKDANEKRDDE